MTLLRYAILLAFMGMAHALVAQTIDCDALASYPASVQRGVFDVCRYVDVDASVQRELACMVQQSDSLFMALVKADGGLLTNKSRNRVERQRMAALRNLLTDEQLNQYYRGVYDAEANAEGIRIADELQKRYGLTDQNWKFIRIAFYKIGLEARVLKKLYSDQPKKAAAKIGEIRRYYLNSIAEKGGIVVDPENMTVTEISPFDPNSLHR